MTEEASVTSSKSFRFNAFISYRRVDGARAAAWLRRRLQGFKLPSVLQTNDQRRKRLKVYLDTIYERAEEDFFENTIKPALRDSEHLIVVQTPGTLQRRRDGTKNWVEREIEYFRTLEQGRNVAIAIAVGDFEDPLPAGLDVTFQNIERVDVRRPRWWWRADGHLLPFVARLHDLSPDDMPVLRQEEARRRVHQLALGLAGVSVIVVALGALTTWALVSRSAAAEAALAAQERERESAISEARARAAQNFAEYQRVLGRVQTGNAAGFEARSLSALAPKYKEQARHHLSRAAELEANLEAWRREGGVPVSVPSVALSLEVLRARSGSSLMLHYGPPDTPGMMIIDGGTRQTYRESIKPRLEELRKQHGGVRAVDLVVASQTDYQHMEGLIEMLGELAAAKPKEHLVEIERLWSNAFLPPGTATPETLASLQPKARLVLRAQELGIALNTPFSRHVTLPQAGSARVHWKHGLSITVLGPPLPSLNDFARGWIKDWQRRAQRQPDTGISPAELPEEFLLETFADPTLELIPSPIDIPRADAPDGTKYGDRSYVNLGSLVLMMELSGRRILLPADSRGDILLSALAQAGYIDANGTMDVDVMAVPHGGSDRNVSVDFFRRVRARHYVFQADGTHANPEVGTFQMLFDARRSDKRAFTIYLTYRPEEYRDGNHAAALCAVIRREREAGTPFQVVTPAESKPSIAIHLLRDVAQLPSGVKGAACSTAPPADVRPRR